ncbi:hypothetical protein [Paraburkholderia diazotrophica]|uniref:Uncharacterized protein n=1 Tax=Paraburkholderia diazotrophica TaxID=667676 RepID=A0A1H6TYW1_9BURK|nr:hypothetical protein [Paraburkholderia diazotrophica]SEI81405.1 hypothetical protein SAMN05192539_1004191 [Paraburkholderia diazotrophica]
MARPSHPERARALIEIRRHIGEYGAVEGPRKARERFPGVGKMTWLAWVRQVRDEDSDMAAEAARLVPRPDAPLPPLTDHHRAATRQAIDFFGEMAAMVDDAKLLADYSVVVDDNGRRRVKNPVTLALANRMRATNINLAMRHSELVWDVSRMQAMFDELIDAISDIDQDVATRVINAMRGVSEKWNIRQ